MTVTFIESETNSLKDLFVETKAYNQMIKTLTSKRYVVIKGNMGDGKTTLAQFAISEMRKLGKTPLQIYDYKEWDDFVPEGKNLVIFIDNIFGELLLSHADVAQWSSRFKSMKAMVNMVDIGTNWNCIIIALRTDILNKIQVHLDRDSQDFLQDVLVDISVGGSYYLNLDEKEQIYNRYLPNRHNFLEVHPPPTTIGFPKCCQIVADSIKKTPESESKIPSMFADPIFVRDYINQCTEIGGMAMAVLVYILFKGGKVKTNVLKDTDLDKEIKSNAMNIFSTELNLRSFSHAISLYEGTFVIHDEQNDTYLFSHNSVMINLFLAVGKTHPLQLLKNCSYDCLSLVTTEDCHSKDLSRLLISSNYRDVLAIRIREGFRKSPLESQNMQTLSELSVWEDEKFVDDYLRNDTCGCTLDLKDENGWSVLVYFAVAGNLKWVRHLCENHIKTTERASQSQGEIDDMDNVNDNSISTVAAAADGKMTQIELALVQACNNEVDEYINNRGGIQDISRFVHDVKAEKADIIKILAETWEELKQKH